jgi:hypothetical protein
MTMTIMGWRMVTPDTYQRPDGRARVRRQTDGKWVVEENKGNGWERVLIDPTDTAEDAIERAEIVKALIG